DVAVAAGQTDGGRGGPADAGVAADVRVGPVEEDEPLAGARARDELVVGQVDVLGRPGAGGGQVRGALVAAELVGVDRRAAQAEVRLDGVPRAGSGVVVVADQVVLHERRVRAGGVKLDPRDVVLDD